MLESLLLLLSNVSRVDYSIDNLLHDIKQSYKCSLNSGNIFFRSKLTQIGVEEKTQRYDELFSHQKAFPSYFPQQKSESAIVACAESFL
jgi:hypothetical protein